MVHLQIEIDKAIFRIVLYLQSGCIPVDVQSSERRAHFDPLAFQVEAMAKSPTQTAEYWKALRAFHKQHPGEIPPVIGSRKAVRLEAKARRDALNFHKKQLERAAGRKDASAPVARRGEPLPRRSDVPGNRSGVGVERLSGNSPSDSDGAMMSRAPEATPKCVGGDR